VKAHCVLFVVPSVRRLSIDIDMSSWPVIPQVGDVMFWDSGWGGQTVEARYVSSDGIELYLGRVGESEAADFVKAGWELRG
jgi:hypothetical protein